MRGKTVRELREDVGVIHKEFRGIWTARIYVELKRSNMEGGYIMINKVSIRRYGEVMAMVLSIKEELKKGGIVGVFGMDSPELVLRMLSEEGIRVISESMYVHDELGIKLKKPRVVGYKFSREAENNSGLKSKGK